MLETPPEKCSACRQILWGMVRYCPFCGEKVPAPEAQQSPAKAIDTESGTAIDSNSGTTDEDDTDAATLPADPPSVVPERKPKRRKQSVAKEPAKEPPVKEPVKEPPANEPVKQTRKNTLEDLFDNDELTPPGKTDTGPGVKPGLLSRKRTWAIALLCGLAYWLWEPAPTGPDACDLALAQAQSSLQQQNAAQADEYSQAALAACSDSERAGTAKIAQANAQALLKSQRQAQERAEQEVRKQAARQQAQQAACEKTNRQLTGLLQSARLESASRNAENLGTACRQLGSTQALLAQISGMQSTAQKAQSDASAQLQSGAWSQARTSIEVLASVNRESPALPELRAALSRAQAASAATQAPRPGPAATVPSAQAELARGFIRDAESHLQQRLYDKAKTFAESARRIDPRNPEVERLLKRIKADELAYMRKEIVIE